MDVLITFQTSYLHIKNWQHKTVITPKATSYFEQSVNYGLELIRKWANHKGNCPDKQSKKRNHIAIMFLNGPLTKLSIIPCSSSYIYLVIF